MVSTTATDYISGIQYDGTGTPAISFIQTEEGRALPNGATAYNYEYSLTDHLGNSRVNFDTGTGVARQVQKDDYMPFGMEISRSVSGIKNEYLYNKKELQENLGVYDYGARFYDPVVARFNVVDQLASKYPWYSPYQYAGNEVPNAIDRDGLEPAYLKPNGTYQLARDGQLFKPLTGEGAKQSANYLKGKTEVGAADHIWDSATENLNNTGSVLIVAGYVGAPFTEGASLSLVAWGEGLSTAGTISSVGNDLSKGNIGGALGSVALDRTFGTLGKIVNDAKGIETTLGKTVLRATIAGGNIAANIIADGINRIT